MYITILLNIVYSNTTKYCILQLRVSVIRCIVAELAFVSYSIVYSHAVFVYNIAVALLRGVSICSCCWRAAGAGQLPAGRPGDPARVLQVDPGGQGPGAVLEESHLQGHRQARRQRTRVLQGRQLGRSAGGRVGVKDDQLGDG